MNPPSVSDSEHPAIAGAAMERALYTTNVYHDLASVPASYERLFAEAARASLFHSLAWYRNFAANALAPGERVRIYGAACGEQTEEPGAALLMRHCEHPGAMWPHRRLQSLANYYSSLTGPLAAHPNDAQQALRAITDRIAVERPRWDSVVIEPLDPATAAFSALEEALRQSGFLVDRFLCFGNWYHELGGQSFKEYFAKRPSKLSQNAPRSRRKLEASGRMRREIVTSRAGLDEAKAAYHAIYLASWKQPEPFPSFIDGLLALAADLGWLRLGVIHIDGIPAAAQIWFVAGDTASIYKMAYDARFTKESVGTVLSSYLMEHVIDVDKVRVVDYLSGDDAYKRDWMSQRRERWGIVAYNPRTLAGLTQAARHFGGRALQRLRSKHASAASAVPAK
ncbi:MAG: GNAT family N-acetyltransferase [Burkholderiales bacterium]|nr:GNAT family N-acetyltransferase [Burkholderiales bacterium]